MYHYWSLFEWYKVKKVKNIYRCIHVCKQLETFLMFLNVAVRYSSRNWVERNMENLLIKPYNAVQ
jgi:hypothetical protein